MKINKYKNEENKKNAGNQTPCHFVFRRDHLRSTSGIIFCSGSFAVQFGDHFRSGDHLRSGIICGAVQITSDILFRSICRWCPICLIQQSYKYVRISSCPFFNVFSQLKIAKMLTSGWLEGAEKSNSPPYVCCR